MKNNTQKGKKDQNIIIYGGSFSPIHRGHLAVMNYVLNNMDVDSLIVIPCKLSPFKTANALDAETRIALCSISLENYEALYNKKDMARLFLDTYEIRSEEEHTYTADTIRHYINDLGYPSPIKFLIGDDNLEKLPEWKDSEYLKNNVNFVVVRREKDSKKLSKIKKDLIEQGYNLTFLENPLFDVSSTNIRKGDPSGLTKEVLEALKKLM